MKKNKIIFTSCLIILIFITYLFSQSIGNISTFQPYGSTTYKLNASSVQALIKNDATEKKEILTLVLDIIKYDKWKDFMDYIDIEIYYGNILSLQSDQLILALTLSKDLAVIVVFEEIDNEYIFHSKIENLSPIEDIQLIKHPTINKDLLLVYQVIDERFGAFFQEKFIQIFNYNLSEFKLVWQKTLFYEGVFKQNWIDLNSSNTHWNKILEETEVNFVDLDSLRINTFTSFKKYEIQSEYIPKDDDFILKEETSYNTYYYWSNKYNTFVLDELTKDTFISNIALLDDMEINRERLFGINNPYYKISTPNGQLIYLPKSKFNGLFKGTLEMQGHP